MKMLKGYQQTIEFFADNNVPMYFVSATAFNLLGIDRWVNNFNYINYIDCFDGYHPHAVSIQQDPSIVFQSIEEISNYLIENKSIYQRLKNDQLLLDHFSSKEKVKVFFLFFDQMTEKLCHTLDVQLALPDSQLVTDIDNKVFATELCNKLSVANVPNVLTAIHCFEDLQHAAKQYNLGDSWVVQTAFGDSGKTTFFIENKTDYQRHADEIEQEQRVKVMAKIRCRGAAMEGCVTNKGVYLGPLLTELIGFAELTPYKGGWCGNEFYPGAFSDKVQHYAQQSLMKLGKGLYNKGYRGYFEADFLIDLDSDNIYLGEINPRLTGISAMTNLFGFHPDTMPLFLFHILEYMNVKFNIDYHDYNRHTLHHSQQQSWGQLILKYTDDELKIITDSPSSGIWQMDNKGEIHFRGIQTDPHKINAHNQAFFIRVSKTGDYYYKGADIGILFLKQKLSKHQGQSLTNSSKRWIEAISSKFKYRDLSPQEQHDVKAYEQQISAQLKVF